MTTPTLTMQVPPTLTRTRAVISGLVLFHITAILAAALPIEARPVAAVRDAVLPYLRFTGLAQGWPMFAPDPRMENAYVEAQITYRDGRSAVWKFPIPSDYSQYDRVLVERYRKWGNDWVRVDQWQALRPDAARFIARAHNDPHNPPVSITLVRYWSPIVPPAFGKPAPPLAWRHETFFTYAVQPGDLQ